MISLPQRLIVLSSCLLTLAQAASASSSASTDSARPQAVAGLIGTVSTALGSSSAPTRPRPAAGRPGTSSRSVVAAFGSSQMPLAGAGVFAYRVTDSKIHRARTDQNGGFTFAALPAGVYKLVVHKTGFLPAVTLVTRTTASAFQELQLQLFPDGEGAAAGGSSSTFWEIRRKIPTDVLRSIELAEQHDDHSEPEQRLTTSSLPFSATMHALTGRGDFANTNADVVGGHLDLAGQVGAIDVGLMGNVRTLQSKQSSSDSADSGKTLGRARALTVKLAHQANGEFSISSRADSLDAQALDTKAAPIGVERLGIGWSGETGPGTTEISASYTSETNYYQDSRAQAVDLPGSSQTLAVEGTYQQRLGRRASLATGVRYSGRGFDPTQEASQQALSPTQRERIDLFGLGGLDLKPAVSLRYGLHTTLADGSVALAPEGGLVLNLNDRWTAETSVRHRLYESTEDWRPGFFPTRYRQQSGCSAAEQGCYRLRISRDLGQGEGIELGALYRNFSDTIRLAFSDDLFDDLNTLYLVDGDRLPELHFSLTRRLSPNVMTRFASNLAEGGGGLIGAQLQNHVRYLVTSFEGQFERSSTGVTLSFHSLEQQVLDERGLQTREPIAKDRVQLHITQGLGAVAGLRDQLNLILEMQVSRGEGRRLAQIDSDELSRRVLGGIALRF